MISMSEMKKYAEQGMTVEMRGVDFGYVDDNHVFRESDFVAKPNEIVAQKYIEDGRMGETQ